MTLEMVFPTMDPKMSYADIAAVIALFFSAFTLAFAVWQWHRRGKSEQIKVAKEIMDSLDTKRQKLNAFLDRNPLFASNQQGDFPLRKSEECVECLLEVLSEIEYFLYLIDKHEIEDKNLLDYYRPKVRNIIDFVLDLCGKVKPDPGTGPVLTLEEVEPEIARYSDLHKSMSKHVESIRQSPWIGGRVWMYPLSKAAKTYLGVASHLKVGFSFLRLPYLYITFPFRYILIKLKSR